MEELTARMDVLREVARFRGQKESDIRKERYDAGTRVRNFPIGSMVLLRTPGMCGKLEEAWEGP